MLERAVSFWRRLVCSPAKPVTAVADERRQSTRYPADQIVYYCPTGEAEPQLRARLRDVSFGGISLLVEKQAQLGELLTVQLPAADGERTVSVLACVVYVTHQSDGNWCVGCTFAGELDAEELLAFCRDTGPSVATADKRDVPRYRCDLGAAYRVVTQGTECTLPALVVNISVSGVGLAIDQPATVGELLDVELSGPKQQSRNLLCCVVHATDRGTGKWLIGCNFITELEEDELNSLLSA